MLKKLIPGLPNALVVGALRFFSIFSFIPKKKRAGNLDNNLKKIPDCSFTGKEGYIENQQVMASVRFGSTDMAYAGCEVIAVYNALLSLKCPLSLTALIGFFEKKGTVFNGRFGTSPFALYRFLLRTLKNVRSTCKREEFEDVAAYGSVFIITYYNDAENIMQQIHTICITKDEEGRMIPHNAYCSEKDIYSVEKLEKSLGVQGRAKIIFMTGIKGSKQKGDNERIEENT